MSDPPSYDVAFDPKAVKELKRLDKPVARRIARAIAQLATEPRPPSSRPLVGHPHLWRLRVGDYRVIYTVRDTELIVLVLHTAHRGSVYRDL